MTALDSNANTVAEATLIDAGNVEALEPTGEAHGRDARRAPLERTQPGSRAGGLVTDEGAASRTVATASADGDCGLPWLRPATARIVTRFAAALVYEDHERLFGSTPNPVFTVERCLPQAQYLPVIDDDMENLVSHAMCLFYCGCTHVDTVELWSSWEGAIKRVEELVLEWGDELDSVLIVNCRSLLDRDAPVTTGGTG